MTNSNYSEYMFLYMNGELSPRDVHFLEHNDNFMRAVMLYGKNYRFFDRCSKNIKNDSEFLKQLIDIYKDNHDFLATMVEEYSNNNVKDYISEVELNILLDEIYEETGDESLERAHENALYFGLTMRNKLLEEVEHIKSKKARENSGYGFNMIDMCYSNSEIIKRFAAKELTKDILMNQGALEFEELVHIYYENKESIIKMGERKFLYYIIDDYDVALKDYLYMHPELLDKYVVLLKDVLSNWDNYLKDINNVKIMKAYIEMDNFIRENNYPQEYKKLFRGIVDLSKNKEKINKNLDNTSYERVNLKNVSIPKARFISHMRNYLDKYFEKDIDTCVIEKPIDEEESIEEPKILKIDFVNKKFIKE